MNRVNGKVIIVLFPGKPFFLGRSDDFSVAEQDRRRVVIVAGDAKDIHLDGLCYEGAIGFRIAVGPFPKVRCSLPSGESSEEGSVF